MKRFLVWLLTDAVSIQIGHLRYVPDWDAIGAMAAAAAAIIGLLAIWYSVRAVGWQLRHQNELDAKHLEQELLLRIMDLAEVPYNASLDHLSDIITWRLSGGPGKNPQFLAEAARKVLEAHRQLSTATASAGAVLRRSRKRRFPRGTHDRALEQYEDLIQKVTAVNGRMLAYASGDWAKFDLTEFQNTVGSESSQISNVLRRVTAEMLARMYADEHEWLPFQFVRLPQADADGLQAFAFADDSAVKKK